MSVVIAVRKDGKVAVACDSQASVDDRVWSPSVTKAIHVGDFFVACIGDLRTSQYFLTELSTRPNPSLVEIAETLEHSQDAVRSSTAEDGEVDAFALDLTTQIIYCIDPGLHPHPLDTPYHVIGSGIEPALGAYHALTARRSSRSAASVAVACIEAACKVILSCAPPVLILES